MASPSHSEMPCSFRFEFDRVNKTLLARVEGRLTDESAVEIYGAIRKYSTATDALAGIFDLSSVTEFAVSAECARDLARREPAMPDATRRPCVIVVPSPIGFGFARMFQIAGEKTPTTGSGAYFRRSFGSTRHSIPTVHTARNDGAEASINALPGLLSYFEVYAPSLRSKGLLISSLIDFAAARIVCKLSTAAGSVIRRESSSQVPMMTASLLFRTCASKHPCSWHTDIRFIAPPICHPHPVREFSRKCNL